MRVPWTAKRANLSVLKEINPEWSLEGQILKLWLLYFGHLMRREDSLEKSLMLESVKARGEGDNRGQDGWHRSYQHEFDPTPGGSGRLEGLAFSRPWGHKESDTT